MAGYTGLFAAAARGDATQITALTAKGERPDSRDTHGRTPLHVAAFGGHHEAMRALGAAGANPNALEQDRYDIVTIAAVANDVATLQVALTLGASAKNVTSRYDGTALIAAAQAQYGMQTFDQSLLGLYREGLITYETARDTATNPDDFDLKVRGIFSTGELTFEGEQKKPAPGSGPAAGGPPGGSPFARKK